MNTVSAPDLTPGYPSNGEKVGPAWNEAYGRIAAAPDWLDGVQLADDLAEKYDLNPKTLVALFTRMATAGHLQRTHRAVKTGRGPRRRTHYKVN
jgi:hypothetical protein